MDGNFDPLEWLVFLGHGQSLTKKDKVSMREAGYMDENDCATVSAERALSARTKPNVMVTGDVND